jgi:signal transduction histidine kinase
MQPIVTRWRYAMAWPFVALTYVALFTVAGAATPLAIRGAVAVALPNSLLGWPALHFARRWPGATPRMVLASVAVISMAMAGWLLISVVDGWSSGRPSHFPAAVLAWQGLLTVLMQVALIAAGYARVNAGRARDSQHRAHLAEALHARVELQLLRSQLNPHFILNTLHALLGLVRRDPSTAEQAIERLGELLRFGMKVEQLKTDRVAVRDEWAFVEGYLELEGLRLGPRLRLERSVDPSALDIPIPPFAIQPLVENAIAHGIAPRGGGGQLRLSIRRDGGRLRVEVEDDGPGASEATILASPRSGLRLLRERMGSLYAGKARILFQNGQEGGLRVILDLPEDGLAEVP